MIDAAHEERVEFPKSLVGTRPLKPDEIDGVTQSYAIGARDDFAYFRQLMRPGMITSWWTREIARAMQQFYEDLIAGKRPMLAIGSPPQHGKSWTATDLIAWVAGKNPDLKAIYASYSDELGTRTNVDLQRRILKHNSPSQQQGASAIATRAAKRGGRLAMMSRWAAR